MDHQLRTREDYNQRIEEHQEAFDQHAHRVEHLRSQIAPLQSRLALGPADNAHFPVQRYLMQVRQDIDINLRIMRDEMVDIVRLMRRRNRLAPQPSPPTSPPPSPPPV